MNKKIVIIIAVVCVFLLTGGYVFWTINQTPEQTMEPAKKTGGFFQTNTENSGTNIAPPTPKTGSKLIFHTDSGEDVSVNDFYKNQQTRLLDEKRDAVLKEDRNYTIDYVATGQSFGISLTGNNLQTSRDVGEQDLLNILGVTKNQACNLNVSVTVPGSVDESAAGVDYGLSFCANNMPLP